MATKIYTKTGDNGTTGLFGGARVPKDSLRIEAYGTVDELNSFIGLACTKAMSVELRADLERTSSHLFTLGADLATPIEPAPKYKIPRLTEEHISELERRIDRLDQELPTLKAFILPGGSEAAAILHVARTVCRRAERGAVQLARDEEIGPYVVRYLNRLSDWLFTAAREANRNNGICDVEWSANSDAF